MPVAHIGGTGWGLVGLINGVKNVVARDFNPMEALEAIQRERIAKMFMVPAALQFIIRHAARARDRLFEPHAHPLWRVADAGAICCANAWTCSAASSCSNTA